MSCSGLFINNIYFKDYLFTAVRGPSPSAASEGCSPVAVPRLLIVVVSLVERGL